MVTVAPLIVTAVLDPASQQRFDDLRRRHLPPDRNFLAAHAALLLRSPDLQRVRGHLARRWAPWLALWRYAGGAWEPLGVFSAA